MAAALPMAVPAAVAETVAVDAASINQRMQQIERRIMALEKTRFTGAVGASGSAVADMELRLQDLERENSVLNGAVERLSKVVQSLAEKIEKQQKDNELRLEDLEKAAGSAGGGVAVINSGGGESPKKTDGSGGQPAAASASDSVVKASSDDTRTTVTDNKAMGVVPDGLGAQEIYSRGYGYLTATSYESAKAWMQAVVARYPDNPLADNAHYWLGEIALVQNNPQEAAVAFRNGLKAFPNGQKAAGNMLKLGVALQKLDKPDLAKSMWEKVVKDFPKSNEAVKAKEYLAKLKG